MAPLTVDPGVLDRAGAEVVSVGEGLGWSVTSLALALSGCAGMAGDDPAGAALGHSYDGSASTLLDAMVSTRNGLCNLGVGLRMSAHNYSLAEARSDVGDQSNPLPTPPEIGPMTVGSTPSSVGTDDGAPPGWSWVAPYIGMIWPTADTAKLRSAAAAWSETGAKFAHAEIQETTGSVAAVRSQQIPEGTAIDAAFASAYRSTTSIVRQCQAIATRLHSYAARVDRVRAAILDLLARICDPLTGIKEVWDVLTGEDEDEIRQIAHDIRVVVDNFTAEAEALATQIAALLDQATTVIAEMGDYAARQWDPFARNVGHAIGQLGQFYQGVGEELLALGKGVWEISAVREMIDPAGYFDSLGGVVGGLAPLVGAAGEHGPAVSEAWKQLGKGLTHWDEWRTNPLEALGKTEVDLATIFLPGGPASKLPKVGTAARDAFTGLRRPPMLKPPKESPATAEPAPRALPREPIPPTKPEPARAGSPVPHSPTESKTRAPHEPAAGTGPSGPRPAEAAPTRALPGEHPSHTHGHGQDQQGVPQTAEPTTEQGYAHPRITISGHGAYSPADGFITVPQNTTITVYADHGSSITDELGNLIESGGDTSHVYSRTFHPGERLPNYTVYPPDELDIMGTPQTVTEPTRLTELIDEDMGDVHLAICPFDETNPTGLVYDVTGIFDETNGIFMPYGSWDIDDV
jgi:hypothetical protein